MNAVPLSVPAAPAIATPALGRLALVDTLRAIALFGVIAMNMMGMAMAFVSEQVLAQMGPLDQAFGAFDMFFLRGKARCMFAFLFGFGFGVLLLRAQTRGQAIVPFYLRRMLILLGFGIVNQLLFFWGDILIAYALVGMILLLFRDLDDRLLLVFGSLLVLLPPILRGAYEALIGPAPQLVAGDGDATYDAMLAVYRSAPYGLEVMRANWSHLPSEWLYETAKCIVVDAGVLGLFLLGFWVARRGILFDIESHRPFLRRIAWIALPLGFALSALNASALMGWEPGQPMAGVVTAAYVGLPIMGFGYLALFALWLSRGGAWLQRVLAPTGRMALTFYLLSGLLGCAFYYGWGLGLLERVGMAEINLFAIAMYMAMVAFSHLWLRCFRLGPAEWLWRRLNGTAGPTSVLQNA